MSFGKSESTLISKWFDSDHGNNIESSFNIDVNVEYFLCTNIVWSNRPDLLRSYSSNLVLIVTGHKMSSWFLCHDFCVADQVNFVLLLVRGCVGVEEEAQVLKFISITKTQFYFTLTKVSAFVISVSMSPVSPVFHTMVLASKNMLRVGTSILKY